MKNITFTICAIFFALSAFADNKSDYFWGISKSSAKIFCYSEFSTSPVANDYCRCVAPTEYVVRTGLDGTKYCLEYADYKYAGSEKKGKVSDELGNIQELDMIYCKEKIDPRRQDFCKKLGLN